MRITVDLDADLIKRLVKESGASSKTRAIEIAAEEYIAMQSRQHLIESFGTLDIKPFYKETRRLEALKGDKIARRLARPARRHVR